MNGREGKGECDGVGNTDVVAVGCDDDDIAWLSRSGRKEGKDTGMNDVSTGSTVSSSCKGKLAETAVGGCRGRAAKEWRHEDYAMERIIGEVRVKGKSFGTGNRDRAVLRFRWRLRENGREDSRKCAQ